VEKDQCRLCQGIIGLSGGEYFRINSHIYCSLGCFYDEDKIKKEGSDLEAKIHPQTNKVNKSKNRVHKKKPKQKKSKK